jgi:hypothetical protein
MARRAEGFNKEKLVFLCCATLFAGVVYRFLTTGPVLLTTCPPISVTPPPDPLKVPELPPRQTVDWYVVSGTDPVTGLAVNRKRKTPFAPTAEFRRGPGNNPNNPTRVTDVTLPPDDTVTDADKDDTKDKKGVDGPKTPKANVGFMGILKIKGQSYALVRPLDGEAGPRRLMIGEKADDLGCTVTKIDKQSFTVKDEKGHEFVLKDSDEEGAGEAAEEGEGEGGGGEAVDGGADGGDKKPPVKKPKKQMRVRPGKGGGKRATPDAAAAANTNPVPPVAPTGGGATPKAGALPPGMHPGAGNLPPGMPLPVPTPSKTRTR